VKLKQLKNIKESSPTVLNFALKLEKPITDDGRKFLSDFEKIKKNFDKLYNNINILVKKTAKTSKTTDIKAILKTPEAVTKELLQHLLDKK
jgi:hypothetical protein